MKGRRSKILSMVIAGVMFVTTLGFFGFTAQDVNADQNLELEPIPGSMTIYHYNVKKGSDNLYFLAWDDEWAIKDVKFSKKKVASLVHQEGLYYVKAKKKGKTTLTFQAKSANSSKYVKKTVKIKVINYKNPVKTFKIGKKSLKKKFNKLPYFESNKTYSGKLKIKAKKGWKVKEIYFFDGQKGTGKAIRNKSKITLDPQDFLNVELRKGKESMYLLIMGHQYMQ